MLPPLPRWCWHCRCRRSQSRPPSPASSSRGQPFLALFMSTSHTTYAPLGSPHPAKHNRAQISAGTACACAATATGEAGQKGDGKLAGHGGEVCATCSTCTSQPHATSPGPCLSTLWPLPRHPSAPVAGRSTIQSRQTCPAGAPSAPWPPWCVPPRPFLWAVCTLPTMMRSWRCKHRWHASGSARAPLNPGPPSLPPPPPPRSPHAA